MYTERITLIEAVRLQEKYPFIKAKGLTEHPLMIRSYELKDWYDEHQGEALHITRADYATYVIGNVPLPDGYGYPNNELSSGIYDGLPYLTNYAEIEIEFQKGSRSEFQSDVYLPTVRWHNYAFRLEDLARVEAEPTNEDATDWKAAFEKQAEKAAKFFLMGAENGKLKLDLGKAKKQLEEAKRQSENAEAYIKALNKKLNLLVQLAEADKEISEASDRYYPF